MTESLRYEIDVVRVDDSTNTTNIDSLVVSQDYDDTAGKSKSLKSINAWVELPIADNCKLVKFEADSAVVLREGASGAEQAGVTFYMKKGTISSSFYVKNTTGETIDIQWNTLGEE